MLQGKIDYLDMPLWDVEKEHNEIEFQGRALMSYLTDIPRGDVELGVTGKIMTAERAQSVLDAGCDFVLIGRGAILRHDFLHRVRADSSYQSPQSLVSAKHFAAEGLGPAFIKHMSTWAGFVEGAK